MNTPGIYARCEMRVLADAAECVARMVDSHPEHFANIGEDAVAALQVIGSGDWPQKDRRLALASGYSSRPELDASIARLLNAARAFADASAAQGERTYRQAVQNAAAELHALFGRFPDRLIATTSKVVRLWHDSSVDLLTDQAVAASLGVPVPPSQWPFMETIELDAGQLVAKAAAHLEADTAERPDGHEVARQLAAAAVARKVLRQIQAKEPMTWSDKETDGVASTASLWDHLRSGAMRHTVRGRG